MPVWSLITCFSSVSVEGLDHGMFAISCYKWCLFTMCLNFLASSLAAFTLVNSYTEIYRRFQSALAKKHRGGREELWECDRKKMMPCSHVWVVCVSGNPAAAGGGEHASARDGAPWGRAANYTSSGMSLKLSAEMEIKRGFEWPHSKSEWQPCK